MPSWNIHIAQTEQLFARSGATARIVRDRNAFLFGSLVPDIYVGYMVPAIEHPIAYRITHFAAPAHIPKPREGEFWDTYVMPLVERAGDLEHDQDVCPVIDPASLAAEQDRVGRIHYPQRFEGTVAPPGPESPADAAWDEAGLMRSLVDFTLGAWAHLVADNLWNTRVNEFLAAHGGKPSEEFRIKKQGDFDLFGKSLPIDAIPRATPRLIATAARFVQYPVEERPVILSVGVAHEIVRTNHGPENPAYRMLTADFFEHVFGEAVELTDQLLAERLGL